MICVVSLILILLGESILLSDIQMPRIRIGVLGGWGDIEVLKRVIVLLLSFLFFVISLVFRRFVVMLLIRKNSSVVFVRV
jgi:hypothetical protein